MFTGNQKLEHSWQIPALYNKYSTNNTAAMDKLLHTADQHASKTAVSEDGID